ncbi:MAG: hypothetical protein JHD21_21390, partial [Nocardioides sp.]|nr:hypothetical protein [Nocardioides sp.]
PTPAAAPGPAEPPVEPAAEPSGGEAVGQPEAQSEAAQPEPARQTHVAPPPMAPAPPRQEALDLGATVLPILAKTYWKHALVALVVVALVVWLIVG